MPDPFEALRLPVLPADPDPPFAADLRARLERALHDPRGGRMTEPTTVAPTRSDRPAPPLRHGDVAYASLWVPDVERAATFFSAVLGWRYAPRPDPQGRQVEGTVPRHGLWGGQARSTLFLCFAVDDVRAAVDRVRDANGEAEEPRYEPYGVVADCRDDQHTPFALVEAPAGPTAARAGGAPVGNDRPGDIAYLTLEVVDSARARSFYGSVLGWEFTPGRVADGWEAAAVFPMIGMAGGQEAATVVPMYRVDDITVAVERARAAGGAATDPERQPYGVTSSCTDDQGTRFYLGQL
jgi:predicted enzyme related to lactoylglutathione lyase